MKKTKQLRSLLCRKEICIAPGAYNALIAKLIEQAGFKIGYITGGGIANNLLGLPDLGLTTMTEVLTTVAQICDVTNIPFIADADTGYGNAISVIRTTRLFERAGASGIQLEDQEFPKKCGHFNNKHVISQDEMVGKIKAALDTRQDADLLVIARTDALDVLGVQAAFDRAHAYVEAGADAIFIEAPRSLDELQLIGQEHFGVPKIANMLEGGRTPLCSSSELRDMGFSLVIYANAPLRAGIKAIQFLLASLKESGSTKEFLDQLITIEERGRITGLTEMEALENRYSIDEGEKDRKDVY